MPPDFKKLMEPCEIHEIWPCAECNGDAARQREEAMRDRLVREGGPVRIGGGVVLAQFPGQCCDCGESFDAEDPIMRSKSDRGWTGVGCC